MPILVVSGSQRLTFLPLSDSTVLSLLFFLPAVLSFQVCLEGWQRIEAEE